MCQGYDLAFQSQVAKLQRGSKRRRSKMPGKRWGRGRSSREAGATPASRDARANKRRAMLAIPVRRPRQAHAEFAAGSFDPHEPAEQSIRSRARGGAGHRCGQRHRTSHRASSGRRGGCNLTRAEMNQKKAAATQRFPKELQVPVSCGTKRHAAVAAESAKWRGHLSGGLSEIPQGVIRRAQCRLLPAALRHRSQGQRVPGASLSV
jgi:hypothetical protein